MGAKVELLNEEEISSFLLLKNKMKISNIEMARMVGATKGAVSHWISSEKIPARCRAYLELLRLKDKIRELN